MVSDEGDDSEMALVYYAKTSVEKILMRMSGESSVQKKANDTNEGG